MILNIYFILSFFNPTINLSSGKKCTLSGKGPPVIFSGGLFGTMPSFAYSDYLGPLKKNFTIVTINGFSPIVQDDIYDITSALSVDSVAYISHSSFNPDVLECTKINKAVLFDPICIPKITMSGLEQPIISVDYPILSIKAEKLYNTDVPLPELQNPIFDGNISDLIYENVGHPDILNDFWADLAKKYGFWDCLDIETIEYKKWTFNKYNSISSMRKKYRKFASDKTFEFISY
tara:strand:+ start:3705 stop:4403 length:699 start_codon:yes stop_codon:yes gene_type:complete